MKTERAGSPMFYEYLDKMADTHSKKSNDYAGKDPMSNFRESEKFGIPAWIGVLIRISDKWSRICNLATSGKIRQVLDESIDDTLLDMANYCILCLVVKHSNDKKN